jgi:excisionase family DNA binding protein
MCPRLLDLPGAAAYLSVSVWTLRDMLAAGTLRAVRLPGAGGRDLRRVLIDARDLDALVEISKEAAP